MNKFWAIAVCMLFITACDNRRTDDTFTARAPEETMDRDNTDNTNRDDNKTSGVFDDRHEDRDYDNELLDGEKEDHIDKVVANAGKSIFISQCASCHSVASPDKDGMDNRNKKFVGPDLAEITDKQNDRWLVKFMTNTDGSDPADKGPESTCILQRNGKELNRDQALKLLEYLHLINARHDAR